MVRAGLAAALAVIPLALAACGNAGAVDAAGDTPDGIAMCAMDTPDCVDVVVDGEDAGWDDADTDAAREQARALLGMDEGELATADARVGRRGDEHMMLTEDYVLGRHTVELDADAGGVFRVTSVITELPEGPETTR